MKNDFCNVCNKVHKKDFVKFPISKFIDGSGKIVNAKKNIIFAINLIFLFQTQILSGKKI